MKRHGLLALAMLLPRLPLLWNPLLHVDEAIFATGTHVWLAGGIPYLDFVETKALGVYLFYALGTWLGGSVPHVNMLAVHALTIVWSWAIALVIKRIGDQMGSPRVGWLAAFFFAAASASFIPEFVCPNIEIILLLPWCAAVALLARPFETLRMPHAFWAGVCTAAALLCKYQAGVLLPAIACWLLVASWKTPRGSWPRVIRLCTVFLLGLIPLPLLMLWYLHAHGALDAFLYWNFLGSVQYIAGGNALIDVGSKVAKKFLPYVATTGIVWFLVGQRLRQQWRARRTPTAPQSEVLLWLWLIGAGVAVAVGKRFFDHYFLLLTPPLALLAAHATPSWVLPAPRRRRAILAAFLIVVTAGFAVARYAVHPLWARLGIEDMRAYAPYGRFLRERTTSADRILVWGYAPAIYWYAERLPATRFLWSDLFVGRIPGAPNTPEAIRRAAEFINPRAWDLLMDDVARHPPAYMIDMAPTGLHHYEAYPMINYPRLMAFVEARYQRLPDLYGAPLWKLKGTSKNSLMPHRHPERSEGSHRTQRDSSLRSE